jgi:hypothetical protein
MRGSALVPDYSGYFMLKSTSLDISELWSSCNFLLAPTVGLIAFHFAKYIHSQRLRIPVRMVTAAFFAVAAGLLMLVALVQLGCSEHARLYSPDGKHVLVISYIGQGALGADYANASVRSRWSPSQRASSTVRRHGISNLTSSLCPKLSGWTIRTSLLAITATRPVEGMSLTSRSSLESDAG